MLSSATWWEAIKNMQLDFFLNVHGVWMRDNKHKGHGKFLLDIKEIFFQWEDGQTLEQVVQRGCEISTSKCGKNFARRALNLV